MTRRDVAIVGAGPAGVASAVALKDRGIRPLLIDEADEVASSWRRRYDRLRLNTSRPTSHLPRRRFPKGTPLFPSRDELVEHIERHAHEEGIELELGVRVDRLDQNNGGWILHTARGGMAAREAIVATGYEQEAVVPPWEGRAGFGGRLLHSSEYRNAEPFAGARVLVVGPGCSGMEIAYDLSEGGAEKVWLSARTPPNIVLRQGPGGLPGDFLGIALMRVPAHVGDAIARFGRRMDLGDLTQYGLPVPEEGVMTKVRRLGQAPAIVDRVVIDAITDGRVEIVPGVESFDGDTVRLADGERVKPDAVICATGFRRALEPLVGHLGVLDERGLPRSRGAEPAAPGLRFIGYVPRPGGLGYMGKEARRAAKAIARELGISGRER